VGVSSFGTGGTNAHVALEEAPACLPQLRRGPANVAIRRVGAVGDMTELGHTSALIQVIYQTLPYLKRAASNLASGA
jgi:acyl transferase domain-containing protein